MLNSEEINIGSEGEKDLPVRKEHPILTYIAVIILLWVIFAIISPRQFQEFVNVLVSTFSQLSLLIVVLAIIAAIAFVLKQLEKI